MTHGSTKVSSTTFLPSKPQRCGRCEWWEGNRARNDLNKTVSFAIAGRCANLGAPPQWANRNVSYLAGADCPAFAAWESPVPEKVSGS
jgi:hypothetical protein